MLWCPDGQQLCDRTPRQHPRDAPYHDDGRELTGEQIAEPGGATWRTYDYKYDNVGNRGTKTDSTASREVSTVYTYNEKDQLQTEEITTTVQRLAQASMPPAPTGFARYGLPVFGILCAATLLCPLGLLLPGGKGIGKRARRRRVFTTTLSLLLALLLIASPQQLYALHVQAQLAQAVAAAALGTMDTTTSTVHYGYDLNGNVLSRGIYNPGTGQTSITQEYRYDAENRMVQSGPAGLPDSGTTVYKYDCDGIRTGQGDKQGTRAIGYVVDKNRDHAQVLVEANVTDGWADVVSYVYGDELISMTRPVSGSGSITRYYHYDGQMSVRQLTDVPVAGNPTVTDRYNYDAFGQEVPVYDAASPISPQPQTTENVYRYTGQQLDGNTGFYYLRARYYSPAVGRFTSMDTYAGDPFAPGSLHKYAYCHGDPVNYADPSGLVDTLVGMTATSNIRAQVATMSLRSIVATRAALIATISQIETYLWLTAGLLGGGTALFVGNQMYGLEEALYLQQNRQAVTQAYTQAVQDAVGRGTHTKEQIEELPVFFVYRTGPMATPGIWQNDVDAMTGARGAAAPSALTYAGPIPEAVKRARLAAAHSLASAQGLTKTEQNGSLDEYPFKSSLQGGPSPCLHVKYVPKKEQDLQGGRLSAFTQRYPVRPLEFLVVPIP